MLRKEPHPRNRQRLLAMAHLQDGKDIQSVADIVKVHYKTVQAWLRRFRLNGFDGLYESKRSGAKRKVTQEQENWLMEKMTLLSTAPDGGFITGKILHTMLQEELSLRCHLKTVYNTLHRLGFSWVTSGSRHPASDEKAQELYKKNLATT